MAAKKDCIITIELGTNAVRVAAFDLEGNSIASMKGSYPTFHTEPDYSEQDPEQIFITMLFVWKNLLNEHIHSKKLRVASICFSASMHSLLAVDKNGVPLGNAITWSDNRAKKEAQQMKQSPDGKIIYTATGTPIHPMSPLFKIAWMKNNDPERFRQTSKFLSLKSYIVHQLTGEYLVDYSIASATGLMNIHNIGWEKKALDYAGIDISRLAELVPVFASAGKLKKAYQNSLGIAADTKILIGSSDGCLATLGAGVWDDTRATVTIEDSGAVRVMRKTVLQDEKQRFFNYLLTEDRYVSGGPTNSGSIIFEWFARQFGDFKNPFEIEYTIKDLIQEASKIPAGSDGLIFLPYLLGERAPIWNANARGVFFGINIKHERRHFIRAALEGILYEIYSIGRTLEEYHKIDSLSINGSFAAIPFFTQMIADIFNKNVTLGHSYYSVGLGAYLLSATEMGVYKNLDEAARTVGFPESYSPRESDHLSYMDCYKLFEKLSTHLSAEFETIADLQQRIGQ
jgi:gluconokinase